MAPRDVIVKIKWNHQKIPNNIISLRYVPKIVKIDEKLTQLYLIKIGPVFLEHTVLHAMEIKRQMKYCC